MLKLLRAIIQTRYIAMLLALFLPATFTACKKEGAAGPQGQEGIQGSKGDKSEKGDEGDTGALLVYYRWKFGAMIRASSHVATFYRPWKAGIEN